MLINREQQRVIDEVEQNILLLASAGTGKTNTLAYRVAHLIEGGYAKAENILCMTFTNKAANEMKDRIQSLVGSPAKAVEVSTFHSFCFFVLQQEGKRNETLYTDVTIFDEEDCKELSEPYRPGKLREMSFANIIGMVKEYRSLYGFYSDDLVGDYKRTIDRLQKEQRAAIEQQFSSFGNVLYSELHDFLNHGHEWIAAYDESLASVHGLDFTDLICGVHRLFQDPVVRERWRSRYSYISVDEMQDTGVLEYKVLEMLWEGNHVLLCGDYFQTIYEWRGSDPFRLLKQFDADFKPLKIIFYENYRSNWTLFTMAFKTLQNMFPDLVGSIYAELPRANSERKGKPVLIKGCKNSYLEGRYIYEAICALPKDANIGVLVRDNKKAQRLSDSFERFINPGVPVGQSEEVHGFSDAYLQEHGEEPAIVLQAFKEFSKNAIIVGHNVNYDVTIFTNELARHNLGNPEFKAIYDTLDIYRRFYPNLPNHKLGFLASEFPINHEPTHNAMDDILATAQLLIYAVKENIVPTTTGRMVAINKYKAAFTNIASQMATLRRKAYTELPTKLLAYIMNQMGVLEYYKSHGEAAKVEHIRDLYRIMEKLDAAYEGPAGLARLNQILQMAALTAGEPAQQVRNEDRIPIITIHQAKGSEFDHVFLAGLNEGTFPSPFAIAEGREDEEKRLFYVAITRPKQELTITFEQTNIRGRAVQPSSLLNYMPRDNELVERRY